MVRTSGNSPKRRNDNPLLTDNMVFVGSLYDEATEEIKSGEIFWVIVVPPLDTAYYIGPVSDLNSLGVYRQG